MSQGRLSEAGILGLSQHALSIQNNSELTLLPVGMQMLRT